MAVFFFPSHGICVVLRIKAASAISCHWVGGGGQGQESVSASVSLLGLEAEMSACHLTAPHAGLTSPYSWVPTAAADGVA